MPAFSIHSAMHIYHWQQKFQLSSNTALIIGNFDGVHRGHQAMLKRLLEEAETRALTPLAVSLYPHPREVLTQRPLALLTTLRDRAYWLAHYGITNWLLLPFTTTLRNTAPSDFIRHILQQSLNARYILVGDDFRFGYRGAGDFALLQSHADSYDVAQLPTITDASGQRISSSAIRQALQAHNLTQAETLLGHPLTFTGKIRHGAGRGRLLNTRTANLHVPPHWCLPDGVYVVKLRLIEHEPIWGVANLGGAPTFGSQQRKLEAHAFAEIGNLYGRIVQISFHHYLRGVIKFANSRELQAQIQHDIQTAQAFIAAQA